MSSAVQITKDANIDKYKYSRYGIGVDSRRNFSYAGASFSQNAINFGAYISCSAHVNNTKNILIHGEGFTQGLEDSTFSAEKI